MRLRSLVIALVGAACAIATTQSRASARSIRIDNPGFPCDLGPLSNQNTWVTTGTDPYAMVDGDSGGLQNSNNFFSPGTVVTPLAIFCEPPVSLSSIWDPASLNYDFKDTPNPASNPDPTSGVPTIPELTATAGVMYEWINPLDTTPFMNIPDAEVIVWTLPSSTSISSTLSAGGYELEFDNWCGPNDISGSLTPIPVPASAVPSFTWYGNKYAYTLACGANGISFNGNDLLFNNSGVLIGYVDFSTNGTTFTSTVPGWQLIAIPGGLSAASGSGSVTLTWTPMAGASSYNVYQSSTAGGEGMTPVNTGITAGTALISGLTNGHVYFFKVTAVYAGVESVQSSEVSATVLPAQPTGFTATPGVGSIALKWNSSAGAITYSIYQGSSSGGEAATPIATGIANTSYTVANLNPGHAYFFNLVALNAGGKSAVSNEVTTTVLASAPTGLSAASGHDAVTLSWSASTGAISYNVYQSTSASGEGNVPVASSITGTSTTIAGLNAGQTYYFKVAAADAGGVSTLSNEASATPTAPPSGSGGGGAMNLMDLLIAGAFVLFRLLGRQPDFKGVKARIFVQRTSGRAN